MQMASNAQPRMRKIAVLANLAQLRLHVVGTKRTQVVLVALVLTLACAVAIGVRELVNRGRWEFERSVASGLSKEAVKRRVGDPAIVLLTGDKLPSWGNAAQRQVTQETWVYYVFPKSQLRFVLSFEDGKVAAIEYHPN